MATNCRTPSRPKPAEVGEVRVTAVRGPKDGRWYWRGRRKGQRDTVWTGWATRDEAMAEVARLVTRGLPEATPTSRAELRTVHDLLAAWLDRQERRPDVKPRTVAHYRLAARHMVAWIGEVPVERLDLLTLERYRDDRLNEGASPRVVNQELKGLRTAWNWASEAGLIPGGTLPRVKAKVRGHRINHHTPTPEDAAAVLAHLDGDRALAVHLLAVTGARISEVVSLRRRDVLLRTGRVVLKGKTGPRQFPLPQETLALLAPRADGSEAPLLDLGVKGADGIRNALARACQNAKVQPFTPHGLRRMVVDRLARSGVDIATAASLTGHSPEVMLRHYRKVSEADRVAAVERAQLGVLLPKTPTARPDQPGTSERHNAANPSES
ncbi:MAG: tyrosine-type recombinase/integrase [Alphaproteobacteria bacterium]|nr:tyrosine-type recombinase/integrase [Alphaproteobacteria bacterium]